MPFWCDVTNTHTQSTPPPAFPGRQSWESSVGQAMEWNGAFASMLFINHWEYTRNATFLTEVAHPLLSGLMEWFACTLQKDPTSGYYVDYPDDAAEGRYLKPNKPKYNPASI